jgi:hypothetical protein
MLHTAQHLVDNPALALHRPEQWNKLEARVVNAVGPRLCLDPSPDVFIAERHLHYERHKSRLVGRPSSTFSQAWLSGMAMGEIS